MGQESLVYAHGNAREVAFKIVGVQPANADIRQQAALAEVAKNLRRAVMRCNYSVRTVMGDVRENFALRIIVGKHCKRRYAVAACLHGAEDTFKAIGQVVGYEPV